MRSFRARKNRGWVGSARGYFGPCSRLPQPARFSGKIRSGSLLCRFLASRALDFALFWPILIEARKIAPTESIPPNLCAATAAKPMDAIHPQDAQSGFPPNWQGVIIVSRSADRVCVVSAKTQSWGLCGGEANCRIADSYMSSFGYCFRNCIMSAIACCRSSELRISGI